MDVAKTQRRTYLSGFGGHFETEAVPGALPVGQNCPQHPPFGLYAEQLSGSAFTVPRSHNQRTWLYRLAPSVSTAKATRRAHEGLVADFSNDATSVVVGDALRWAPPPLPGPGACVTWIDSLRTVCGAGRAADKEGLAIHLYAFNAGMTASKVALVDSDGDLLVVPQVGALLVTTELGCLEVAPGEICVIPRNVCFAVDAADGDATSAAPERGCRGYVLESFSASHFAPPDRGVIGANCLAETRDFLYPTAWFEDREGQFTVTSKLMGDLFDRPRSHSPFDVVAWHGNYAPFKYNLARFVTLNTVSVDHPDPSIYTVLSVPSAEQGASAVDFVVFPPRWMCAEHTFRPPYFHRNCMSEFMGLIHGTYDAKKGGFAPGGSSLHGIGVPHGPDAATHAAATAANTSTPAKFEGGTAFMFEARVPLRVNTPFATEGPGSLRDPDYLACWRGLPRAKVPLAMKCHTRELGLPGGQPGEETL